MEHHLAPPSPRGGGGEGWRTAAALALGAAGIAASVATLYASPIEGVTDLGCGPRQLDCGEALSSRWSQVGGIPLGAAGGAYFAFWMACLAAGRRRRGSLALWAATCCLAAGAAVSLILLAVLAFVLRSPCSWCLAIHAANLGAAALLWPLRQWRPGTARAPAALAAPALAALLALLAGASLLQLYHLRVERAEAMAREKTLW